ncbi:MAG TPA: IS5 family transposase [Nitrososphaerales archaeon]|nr:IS5 family transposase [Nitrososphaerales archaeon]
MADLTILMPEKKKRNWKEYNESLVRRGELLFDTDFLSGWGRELKGLNEGKEGARYRYPDSLMSMLAAIHVYLLPYRELEGFLRMFSGHVEGLKVPDYTTMWWRISRVKIELDPDVNPEQDVTIAVDSTGIKVSNRGEWIRQKWAVKRGFIKVHLAVDVKTGKILSMEVTKEDVPDERMLVPLVEGAASRASVTRAIGDGAYDSRAAFRYLDAKGIEPVIKVRKNASPRAMGCMPRKLVVVEQLKDYERWKRRRRYGQRARVESAISSFKRTFGEHITSVKWSSIVNELLVKATVYNLFVGINP